MIYFMVFKEFSSFFTVLLVSFAALDLVLAPGVQRQAELTFALGSYLGFFSLAELLMLSF